MRRPVDRRDRCRGNAWSALWLLAVVLNSTIWPGHVCLSGRWHWVGLTIWSGHPALRRRVVNWTLAVGHVSTGRRWRASWVGSVHLHHTRDGKRLSLRHDADRVARILAEERDGVSVSETPLEPELDGGPEARLPPLLPQDLLVLGAASALRSREAGDPEREADPADGAEPQASLAQHESAEPEIALEDAEHEESGDYRGDDDDPHLDVGTP